MPFLNQLRSANVENLRAEGVVVHELRPISLWENRWSVRVEATREMPKTAFKRLVERFLELEFEASEFDWFRAKTDGQNKAFCHFKTFAL